MEGPYILEYIPIPEDIPWEDFVQELYKLILFPEAVTYDYFRASYVADIPGPEYYTSVQAFKCDSATVTMLVQEWWRPVGAACRTHAKRLKDAIESLIRSYGAWDHRDRTTRG